VYPLKLLAYPWLRIAGIEAQRGSEVGGGERVNIIPLKQISKHLLIKCNKTRNRVFPESLDPPPPRDFGKKHQVPPPLDFQPVPCASMIAGVVVKAEDLQLSGWGFKLRCQILDGVSQGFSTFWYSRTPKSLFYSFAYPLNKVLTLCVPPYHHWCPVLYRLKTGMGLL
jgi:hypothetical protein